MIYVTDFEERIDCALARVLYSTYLNADAAAAFAMAEIRQMARKS